MNPEASAGVEAPPRPSADQVLRATTEQATEGFLLVGLDGIIRSANPAICRLTGYSPEDLIGQSALILNMAGDRAASERARDALTVDGAVEWRRRREYRRQDGSSFLAEVRAYPVKGSDGTVVAMAGHVVPVIAHQALKDLAVPTERSKHEPIISPLVGYLEMDSEGSIDEVNSDFCELLGWDQEDLVGRPKSELRHPEDAGLVETALAGLVAGADGVQWIARYRRSDGSYLWGDVRATAIRDATGKLIGARGSMIDVSVGVQRRQDRALSEGLLIEATERAPIGQALVTLDGYFAQVNAAFCTITGYDRPELTKLTFQSITHPADLNSDTAQAAAVADGSIPSYEMDKRYVRKNGSIVWVRLYVSAIRDDSGATLAFVSQVIDISLQKEAEIAAAEASADLSFRSRHDVLTGLPNRDAIHEALLSAVEDRSRSSRFAVMFIDVDRFKSVNDGISHTSGDQVLVEIARRLRQCLAPGDIAGRFGGDEFVVVSFQHPFDQPFAQTAERIRSTISESEILLDSDRGIHVTVSIGISIGRPGASAAEMLSEADAAMYQAKSQGRDCCIVADDSMREQVQRRVELAGQIRGGIARAEFVPWFQPIVEFSTDRVVGFEALARWVRADRTLAAADFIDVAQEAGSIRDLGRLVITRTIEHMGAIGDCHLMTINASPTEIADPDFGQVVSRLLREHNVAPTSLAIEITEHALMNLGVDARDGLLALTDSGVGLFVDDFGTGYSSISTLHHYPVTGIKLDLSFTAPIGDDPHGQAAQIAGGLADLAERLKLIRIAEGVETEAQSRALAELGWTMGQGWRYGRAAPATNSVPGPREESQVTPFPVDASDAPGVS